MVAWMQHAQSFYYDLSETDLDCQFKMETRCDGKVNKTISEKGPCLRTQNHTWGDLFGVYMFQSESLISNYVKLRVHLVNAHKYAYMYILFF